MSLLTFEQVSHYYFSKHDFTKAVEDISFTIEEGEFVSLVGPSGCGKSTILSIIAKLINPTDGKIFLKQKPYQQVSLKVGYMLQQDYLFPWKTILQNILIGPKIIDSLSEDTINRATELLTEVGLKGSETAYPNELSGGMRQRVALVRTLITNPDVLLFDEPFSALDYVTRLRLENLVAKLMKSYGKTVILVTHDLGEAISMSDKILLMQSKPGKIVKSFSIPNEIREETPFYVRRLPEYQPLFDEIWAYLNVDDTDKKKGMTTK